MLTMVNVFRLTIKSNVRWHIRWNIILYNTSDPYVFNFKCCFVLRPNIWIKMRICNLMELCGFCLSRLSRFPFLYFSVFFFSSIYSHACQKCTRKSYAVAKKSHFELECQDNLACHKLKPVCNSAYLLKSSNKKQKTFWVASQCGRLSISYNEMNRRYVVFCKSSQIWSSSLRFHGML